MGFHYYNSIITLFRIFDKVKSYYESIITLIGDGNMDKTNEKHFGLRVDGDILAKFRYVCGFEGRSANAQIIQLMLKFIADYEKEHGKIQLD